MLIMDWNTNGLLALDWFKQMRMDSPIAAVEGDGAWNVFKYEDVKAVFTNYEVFSSQGSSSTDDPIESSVLRQDPPKHRQLRKLVSHAFTPRMIESLAPKIQEITTSLLDEAEKKGTVDIVEDLASPLPITVIAEMLGVSMEYRERFKAWSDALVGNNSDAYYQCQQEMSEYFSEIAEDRRRHPQDDLITKLVEARIDNEHLTDLEIIGFCILLLVAGNETTTNLISSAVLAFDSLPGGSCGGACRPIAASGGIGGSVPLLLARSVNVPQREAGYGASGAGAEAGPIRLHLDGLCQS
ncbi:cytochrome P450 [Paenibacillus vortex V453]|uniref:Cytochrome P450 n=1 Tax=Paenibacillus vortex V453 TaxID=715225 RepID=A0A2R9T2P5_9BACL|nr:cytochrome P450 [Paenibacillus vortex V453]